MQKREFTRDQAIAYVVGNLTRHHVASGQQVVPIVGGEVAAKLVLGAFDEDAAALEVLGVTLDDVRRVARDVQAASDRAH